MVKSQANNIVFSIQLDFMWSKYPVMLTERDYVFDQLYKLIIIISFSISVSGLILGAEVL